MANKNSQWLKLTLKDGFDMKDVYLSVYTHFSIYSSCIDQGYSLAFYQLANHRKELPGAVCYIKTDHDGFYDSCLKYYSRSFEITKMAEDFTLPAHYELAHGADREMSAAKAV